MKPLLRVLFVDDSPADVGLACEALAEGRQRSEIINVIDGEEAMAYLHRVCLLYTSPSPRDTR